MHFNQYGEVKYMQGQLHQPMSPCAHCYSQQEQATLFSRCANIYDLNDYCGMFLGAQQQQ